MSEEPKLGDQGLPERDFNNMRIVEETLVNGNEEEVERLRLHIEQQTGEPLPKEKLLLYREFARQRHRHIQTCHEEYVTRIARNPKATEVEYALGIYREWLEPPVRDAVFRLRAKGYNSYESGFGEIDSQQISFDERLAVLETFAFSASTLEEMKRLGVEPIMQSKRIGFRMTKGISDEDLTHLWNLIAADLPVVDPPQPFTQVPTAVMFRKKQDEMKNT